MDQQPHGNFVAFLNRSKEPGDNKPTFDGRLAVPGGEELRLALWAHEFKNGKTGETQIRAISYLALLKDRLGVSVP